MKWIAAIIFLFFSYTFISCNKEDKIITNPNAQITTSVDTVKFDTVFVNSGSVTQLFKIFNNNKQAINFSSIKLMGGNASAYKMNVDGLPGIAFNNIEVTANDSVYVYVTVNVNPNTANTPFVVRDSVQLQYNGNTKYVQLQAFGKNAIFLNNTTITANTTWSSALPYVILDKLTIAENVTLTIPKATKIYSHANAPIIVNGTLITNGQKDTADRIEFLADRLDAPYNAYPGAWPGIYFTPKSKNNVLNYTTIKNAYQAIIVDSIPSTAAPKLTLNQCIIDNAYDIGIISIGSSVNATNCLISNCGKNLVITYGGVYNFNHCTIASYSNSNVQHTNAVFYATNYLKIGNTPYTNPNGLQANFSNCIFWGEFGTVENEIEVDKLGAGSFIINFNKCIYKVKTTLNPLIVNTIGIANMPPQFDSISTPQNFYNFRLKNTSPAFNTGVASSINIDLDGKPRPVGLPDIGAFEKQ